jgi:hypothetical protein
VYARGRLRSRVARMQVSSLSPRRELFVVYRQKIVEVVDGL